MVVFSDLVEIDEIIWNWSKSQHELRKLTMRFFFIGYNDIMNLSCKVFLGITQQTPTLAISVQA